MLVSVGEVNLNGKARDVGHRNHRNDANGSKHEVLNREKLTEKTALCKQAKGLVVLVPGIEHSKEERRNQGKDDRNHGPLHVYRVAHVRTAVGVVVRHKEHRL